MYNASLETPDPSSTASYPGNKVSEKEVSRSPTSSSCTSGYFSHSASNATLSDAPFTGSESSDQLCSASRDQAEAGHCQSGPVQSSSNCTAQSCSPKTNQCALSISQEFTDFKGAGDGFSFSFESDWPAETPHSLRQTNSEQASADACQSPHSPCSLHNGKDSPSSSSPSTTPTQTEDPEDLLSDKTLVETRSSALEDNEGAPVAQLPDWMAPGEQVWVGTHSGTVHYVGGVEFAKGIWVGVELDRATGTYPVTKWPDFI